MDHSVASTPNFELLHPQLTPSSSLIVIPPSSLSPSPSRSNHQDQQQQQQQQLNTQPPPPTQYHRYIPPIESISLQSDAPGYYDRLPNQRDVNVDVDDCIQGQDERHPYPGSNLHDSNTNPSLNFNHTNIHHKGPICWKCRGTGRKHKVTMKKQSNPTAPPNDETNNVYCTVCCGFGRMNVPIVSPNIDIRSEGCHPNILVGMITRGRRQSQQQQSQSQSQDVEPSIHDCTTLEPVGYTVPYYGSLVQQATTQCTDIRIIYRRYHDAKDSINGNEYHTTVTSSSIIRIEIGNRNKDCSNTTNSNDDGTEQVYKDVKWFQSVYVPTWLPIQQGNEQLCNFVGRWRILQRQKSHRYTTDDVVTAVVASQECFHIHNDTKNDNNSSSIDNMISYCDLGTGNGSVLQMILWKVLSSSSVDRFQYVYGFEARKEAVELLLRSLDFNIGTDTIIRKKVTIVRTDFRSYCDDPNNAHFLQNHFDIVTGTPPYFQVDFHIPSSSSSLNNSSNNQDVSSKSNQHDHSENGTFDATKTKTTSSTATGSTNITATIRQGGMPLSIQSAPARCEFRGGIEEYCRTASYLLKPGSGQLCICENYSNHRRALQSFCMHHLVLIKYYIIEGKAGRGPLFCVYVARKKADLEDDDDMQQPAPEIVHLAVRNENGDWTDDYKRMVLNYMSIIY